MRLRSALFALLLLVAAPSGAVPLTPEDKAALTAALEQLAGGHQTAAGRTARTILEKPEYTATDLQQFFARFLDRTELTPELGKFLGSRALGAETPGRARALQGGLALAAAGEIDTKLRGALPDRLDPLLADPRRVEALRTAMTLLGRIAFEGDALAASARREAYGSLRDLIAAHPDVLRRPNRIDVTSQPHLAVLRAQLYKNLQDLLRPFDRERFIRDTGFYGTYAELIRNHGVLVLDNNGLDASQRRAVKELLALIPPSLHRTAHISVFDLLGIPLRGPDRVRLVGSRGVNIASVAMAAHANNGFPEDVEGVTVPTFCSVLQHELNHMVDHHSVSGDPKRRARRDALIARAGSDPEQYLRSMLEPGFFVRYPQEFFASISNAYFADAFQTLLLAVERSEDGAHEPLNQFLFFADVYSLGGTETLFVRQSSDCEFSLHAIPIGRKASGRIDRIRLPDATLRFTLDPTGFVIP
jgi:hypothetical protein